MGAIVERGFVGELAVGDFGDDDAVVLDSQHAVVGDAADGDGVKPPLLEDIEDFVLTAGVGHDEHALLRFGEHDLVRGHAGFALGDEAEVDFNAGLGAAAHFAGGAGEPGGAHILNADDGAGVHGFEAGFEEELLHERVANLDVGALFLRLFGEDGGGHGCAVDAVAAGFRADVDDRVADAGGPAKEDFIVAEDAESEDVDQRIAVVAFLEDALAADGGDSEAVAVMRDATDYAREDAAIAVADQGVVKGAEADGVEHGDGARAHGEDVAEDAADAGGRALERLDETGVVVGLDLKGDGVVVADVDNAGIFAGADEDSGVFSGELLEVEAGAFVGAMLAPHDGEDAFLGLIGVAAEDGAGFGEFRIGELAHGLWAGEPSVYQDGVECRGS